MRQPRTRKASKSKLIGKLKTLMRNVVGRKWGNYITLNTRGEGESVSFTVKPSLKRSILHDLYKALLSFAQGNKWVAYQYGSHAVSVA